MTVFEICDYCLNHIGLTSDSYTTLNVSGLLTLWGNLNWKVNYGYKCASLSMLRLNFALTGIHFLGKLN